MSFAVCLARSQLGLHAPEVYVEVHVTNGLPRLSIVGLAETAVKESKDRVRSAILNSGLMFPNHRITINLAPADLPKEGSRYDLAIAIGILAAARQLPMQVLEGFEFAGELALSGEIRAIANLLPWTVAAERAQHQLFLPVSNVREASLVTNAQLLPSGGLLDVYKHLRGDERLEVTYGKERCRNVHYPDFADVYGQEQAKRALTIAAAGGHSVLMVGSPGSGKTMLATRVIGILPSPRVDESLEIAMVASLDRLPCVENLWGQRPFCAPHHTSSNIALIGGGQKIKPGAVSRSHGGVLFLDELPEFSRSALEVLREPMSTGEVRIARAGYHTILPARFLLIAAMNPCTCGYYGSMLRDCTCRPDQVQRYQQRLSGPLLDRIDIRLGIQAVQEEDDQLKSGATSATMRQIVEHCRSFQATRQVITNAELEGEALRTVCVLGRESKQLLKQFESGQALSMRGRTRVLRIARTIADLESKDFVEVAHLSEALSYQQGLQSYQVV